MTIKVLTLAAWAAATNGFADVSASILDSLAFGDPKSESRHAFNNTRSEKVPGGLNGPARRLLPLEPQSWEGGHVSFTLKVAPRSTVVLYLEK
jgi:hypothetical protein